MTDARRLLERAYAAFNARDVAGALAVMHADVDWPNGLEGGRVAGHAGVREYWTRQWSMLDPMVIPTRFTDLPDGRVAVDVRQVVRALEGRLLKDALVRHVYTLADGLVRHLEIGDEAGTENLEKAVPFFRVADMERSRRFYVDGLRFEIRHRWEVDGDLRWCWLQRGDVALMLQRFGPEGEDTCLPRAQLGAGVSICFLCRDAVAFYREVTARGLPARRPFVGNAMWVTTLTDPDGYALEFESPTDAPEESELVERDGPA